MKRLFSLLIFTIFLLGSTVSAQNIEVEDTTPVRYIYVYTNPLDQMFERDATTGILRLPDNQFRAESIHGLGFRDTLFVNPLFLPIVFSGRTLPRNFSFFPPENESDRGILIPQRMTFAPQLAQIDFAQNVRRQFYIDHPTRIQLTVADLPDPPAVSQEEYLRAFNPLRGLFRTETTLELAAPTVEGVTIERRFWQRRGDHNLTFSQNFFSDNWYRRANSHLHINSHQQLWADYHRDRVRFENHLYWRLVLQSTPDDTLRRHAISNDRFRYFGNFSLAAADGGRWSYSATLEVLTQILNHYPVNSPEIRAAFLSPITITPTIGMTYRLRSNTNTAIRGLPRNRYRWELDLTLSPFSPQFVYVNHPDVDVRRHGIDEGRRYNLDWRASSVNFQQTYFFTRHIIWFSRFNYWTSYSRITMILENRLTMNLTNAFSTIIYLQLRYDDGVERDERFGHLQVNQMLSFGLRYTW